MKEDNERFNKIKKIALKLHLLARKLCVEEKNEVIEKGKIGVYKYVEELEDLMSMSIK